MSFMEYIKDTDINTLCKNNLIFFHPMFIRSNSVVIGLRFGLSSNYQDTLYADISLDRVFDKNDIKNAIDKINRYVGGIRESISDNIAYVFSEYYRKSYGNFIPVIDANGTFITKREIDLGYVFDDMSSDEDVVRKIKAILEAHNFYKLSR